MIATSAHESIHQVLLVLRLSSKWRKEVSAPRIIASRNVDKICQKIKIIKSNFWPIRYLRGKKQKKTNLIQLEEKNDIKDKFLQTQLFTHLFPKQLLKFLHAFMFFVFASMFFFFCTFFATICWYNNQDY